MTFRQDNIHRAVARDNYACHICGANDGQYVQYRDDESVNVLGDHSEYTRTVLASQRIRYVEVKLTVIHRDHNLKNFAEDNLRTACQRHRRHYHKEDFARLRDIRRRRKMLASGFQELFPHEETSDGRLKLREDVPVITC